MRLVNLTFEAHFGDASQSLQAWNVVVRRSEFTLQNGFVVAHAIVTIIGGF
tara:strand:- start:1788 stop:1940 length:153 start_codon:yes stop_codon:yes gene_type:complete